QLVSRRARAFRASSAGSTVPPLSVLPTAPLSPPPAGGARFLCRYHPQPRPTPASRRSPRHAAPPPGGGPPAPVPFRGGRGGAPPLLGWGGGGGGAAPGEGGLARGGGGRPRRFRSGDGAVVDRQPGQVRLHARVRSRRRDGPVGGGAVEELLQRLGGIPR